MELEKIVEKKNYYVDCLKELESRDIQAEIDKRLQPERERIIKEVTDEIEADKSKCNAYIAVLNELIADDEKETHESIEPSASSSVESSFASAETSNENIGG